MSLREWKLSSLDQHFRRGRRLLRQRGGRSKKNFHRRINIKIALYFSSMAMSKLIENFEFLNLFLHMYESYCTVHVPSPNCELAMKALPQFLFDHPTRIYVSIKNFWCCIVQVNLCLLSKIVILMHTEKYKRGPKKNDCFSTLGCGVGFRNLLNMKIVELAID